MEQNHYMRANLRKQRTVLSCENLYSDLMAANPSTQHPHDTGETFGEHFGVAMGVSRQLAGAAAAAFVHAIMPNFHKTTASDKIQALNCCLERHDRDGLKKKATLQVVDGAA